MTELKSLKDFFCNCGNVSMTVHTCNFCNKPFLYGPLGEKAVEFRQEAVEWIKAGDDEYRIPRDQINAINNFIKEFFNITEEDLK